MTIKPSVAVNTVTCHNQGGLMQKNHKVACDRRVDERNRKYKLYGQIMITAALVSSKRYILFTNRHRTTSACNGEIGLSFLYL